MQIVYTLALQGQSVYWGHGLLGIILGKVGSLLDLASRLLLSPEPRVPFSLNVSTESRPIQHTQKLQENPTRNPNTIQHLYTAAGNVQP